MRKIIITLLFAVGLLLPLYAASGSTLAVGGVFKACNQDNFKNVKGSNGQPGPDVCQDQKNQSGNPIIKIIKIALEIVSWIAGIAATILIIVSAVKFMTSGGDSAAVASARTTLINAVIGMVVIFVSQGIIALITGSL